MLTAEWSNDWVCPYPFRLLRLESEHDTELGQWVIAFAFLGISVELTWVYDENTPLRAKLNGMMADDSWLSNARVTMPHADYEELKRKADAYDELGTDDTDGAGA